MWTRIAGQALLPLNLTLELAVLALLLRWRGRRRVARVVLVSAAVLLWASATPRLAHALLAGLESGHAPRPAAAYPEADAIVVLGGMMGPPLPPREGPDLGGGADRLLQAWRLWRAGRARLVVTSGGYAECGPEVPSEARCAADLLQEWGLPGEAVLVEGTSADTHENAVHTAVLLRSHGLRRVLLVTSAAHMRRAAGAFRAQGVEVVPAPTDVLAVEQSPSLRQWLPDAEALAATTVAVHEVLGTLYYRWRGWID